MKSRRPFLWFLFGLGSYLQLFGTSLCFTEIFVYGAAVVLISSEWPYMKRNGVTTFFWLSMGVMVNGAVSCLYNHSPLFAVIRGMAVVCLLPCAIVVCHWMLRKDMANFKWMLVGLALSVLLSTFVFQGAAEVAMASNGGHEATAADIMNGPIWLVSRLGKFATCIPQGWYLHCPLLLSAGIPLGMAAFALFTTASGRSAALGSLGSALLVSLGGKKRTQIRRRVCKRFWLLCILGILTIGGFKTFYKTAATGGWLGEESQKKYEMQTKGGEGVLAILLGGRMDSFCGLVACVDRPIMGFGPWAVDTQGYVAEFLLKYGAREDYEQYEASAQRNGGIRLIPGHSFITQFWLWYGIMGLIFWLYVIFVLVRYLRQDCYAVPQWYMWLAAGMPGYLWGVLFSPFGGRVGSMMFVVAVLMVRAVRTGKQQLPASMEREIMIVDRK